jgi:hypothetical protein
LLQTKPQAFLITSKTVVHLWYFQDFAAAIAHKKQPGDRIFVCGFVLPAETCVAGGKLTTSASEGIKGATGRIQAIVVIWGGFQEFLPAAMASDELVAFWAANLARKKANRSIVAEDESLAEFFEVDDRVTTVAVAAAAAGT